MWRWIVAFVLAGSASQADVLGLNDYDALFADTEIVVDTLDDGSRVITLPGDVQIMQSDTGITTLDLSNGGAVGCFVRILSQIAAYQQACDAPLGEDLMMRHGEYRDRVLDFYAENARPVTTTAETRARFDALVEVSVPNAEQYCQGENDITRFMESVLSADTSQVVDVMTATPRLPADNPCL